MDPFSGALFAGLGFLLMMAAVLPMLLTVVALIYVALRVRDAKADMPDPELGLKTAYWFLYTLGILVVHLGLTILFTYWFQKLVGADDNQFRPQGRGFAPIVAPASDEWNPASRTGWALMLAGGLVTGAFYMIGAFGTRDREWPSVRRLYVGGRLAVAGMFTIFAFVSLVVIQFQKDVPAGGLFQSTLAMLAVWVPSLAIHIFLFRWGGTPAYHVPPAEVPKRRRPPRRYDEEDERTEAEGTEERPAAEGEQPPRRRRADDEADEHRPADDDEERPRRRRPRDDD